MRSTVAPVSKKSVTRKTAPKTGTHVVRRDDVRQSVETKDSVTASQRVLSDAERQQMVATAAYYIAEKRGFNSGDELSDWFAAEEEIAQILGKNEDRRH